MIRATEDNYGKVHMNYDEDAEAERESHRTNGNEDVESYHMPGYDGEETTELSDIDAALDRLG